MNNKNCTFFLCSASLLEVYLLHNFRLQKVILVQSLILILKIKKAFNFDVSNNDAQKLAQSIEFKVYKIDEMTSSESIYESPAGICQDLRLQEV